MMLEGFNWMTRNRWPVVRFKCMTFLKGANQSRQSRFSFDLVYLIIRLLQF